MSAASAVVRQKSGRRSTIAAHPQRLDIELAHAAAVPVRTIARRFGVSPAAVDRHWHALPSEYRASLIADARRLEGLRWNELAASLLSIAQRHPTARAEVLALADRMGRLPAPSNLPGALARAA
jgi:DNA-binding transcriptional ArsR family regulator